MGDAIESILAARRQQEGQETSGNFFSVLSAHGLNEEFLELRFRNGAQTCFCYKDLSWFNYSPDDKLIDLEFNGFLVTIKGRGLIPKLFEGIKNKRVAWVREADTELQDCADFESYIESLLITPPQGMGEEGG